MVLILEGNIKGKKAKGKPKIMLKDYGEVYSVVTVTEIGTETAVFVQYRTEPKLRF